LPRSQCGGAINVPVCLTLDAANALCLMLIDKLPEDHMVFPHAIDFEHPRRESLAPKPDPLGKPERSLVARVDRGLGPVLPNWAACGEESHSRIT